MQHEQICLMLSSSKTTQGNGQYNPNSGYDKTAVLN